MKSAWKNDQENCDSTVQEVSQEEEESDLTLAATWDEDRAAKPKAVLCLLDQVFQFDMRNSSTSSSLVCLRPVNQYGYIRAKYENR